MRSSCSIRWSENCSAHVATNIADLTSFLERLHKRFDGEPTTLELLVRDDVIYFSVGLEQCAVTVQRPKPNSEWTLEFTALGNADRTDEVDFSFFGHHTPRDGRTMIPFATALELVIETVRTAELPETVAWDENSF